MDKWIRGITTTQIPLAGFVVVLSGKCGCIKIKFFCSQWE